MLVSEILKNNFEKNKKILVLIFSFIIVLISTAFAANSINSINWNEQTIEEGDVITAAYRYCTDFCAVSWWENCAGWVSSCWFMNEIDSTNIVITCIWW